MDIYQREIERLVNADYAALERAWSNATPLFQYCDPEGRNTARYCCGCLTMVRSGSEAYSYPLTESIRRDERIPLHISVYYSKWATMGEPERRRVLEVFRDWQLAMDMTIRQGKPWHPEWAPAREEIEAVLI